MCLSPSKSTQHSECFPLCPNCTQPSSFNIWLRKCSGDLSLPPNVLCILTSELLYRLFPLLHFKCLSPIS